MSTVEKVSLAQKLSLFQNHWSPRIIGELNDSQIKVVKAQGEFVWHHHTEVDELFLVIKGRLLIKLREDGLERAIALEPGELVVIPKGVEHCPYAEEEVEMVLLEQKGTVNTGNVHDAKTAVEQWI